MSGNYELQRAFALKPPCESWTSSLNCGCSISTVWTSHSGHGLLSSWDHDRSALLLCTSTMHPYMHLLIWLVVMLILMMFMHRVSLHRPLILWIMCTMGLLWRHFDATSTDCVRVSWVHAGLSRCLFSSNNLNSLGSERLSWSGPVFSNLRRMFFKKTFKSTCYNLNRILFGE